MLAVYLFAAIVGGGLLLIALLGVGGDGDGGGAAGDSVQAGVEPGGSEVTSAWNHLLSLQTAAYVLAAFGLTGVALTWLDVAALPTLGAAVAMGVLGGGTIGWFFGLLRRSESGIAEASEQYIGGVGKTEVRIPHGGRGRIQLVHRGSAFTLPAISNAGEIERHEQVVIIDVVDGVALVDKAPEELTRKSE